MNGVFNVLPNMVNVRRGAASRISHVLDISNNVPCPGSFNDNLPDEEIPSAAEKDHRVWLAKAGNMEFYLPLKGLKVIWEIFHNKWITLGPRVNTKLLVNKKGSLTGIWGKHSLQP